MKPQYKAVLGLAAAVAIGSATASCSYLSMGNNAYVAKVNGHVITESEYNKALDQAKRRYGAQFHVDFNSEQGKQLLDNLKTGIVQQLTERELLGQEADKRNIRATDAEIDGKMKEIKGQFPDPATFEKALKEYGVTEGDMRLQVSRNIAIEHLQQVAATASLITDADIADYYAKNKATFTHTEEVNARHILIKVDEQSKDKKKDDAAALAKVKALQAKIKGGADFGKLAKENSDDPGSKASGGDMGFYGKGRMVPEFEKAAFSLKKGELSQPVKTQFGYHLLMGGDRHPASVDTLDKVKDQIRGRLVEQKRGEGFRAFVASLQHGAKIEYKPAYAPKPGAPFHHPG